MKNYERLRAVYMKQTLDKGAVFIHKAQATVQYVALTSLSPGNPPVLYEWKLQNLHGAGVGTCGQALKVWNPPHLHGAP